MDAKSCIAIDGPAGVGKSTVARAVASKLGFAYIDTGAMYRAITLRAIQEKIDFPKVGQPVAQASSLWLTKELAACCEILLSTDPKAELKVFLNGVDVSKAIRQPLVSKKVSFVASVPEVRQLMVSQQRAMAAGGGVVMEGRDIGTVVLPWAYVKIFLTASLEERARRRYEELVLQGNLVNLKEITAGIEMRDRFDKSREVAPLIPALDATVIDCSCLGVQKVVDLIVSIAFTGRVLQKHQTEEGDVDGAERTNGT